MKVFISWLGKQAAQVAISLRDWFPKVIQGITPFVSAKDIDKGANWSHVLSEELNDSAFGVICLTPENLLSPWLNYEAGAIMRIEASVCEHSVQAAAVTGGPLTLHHSLGIQPIHDPPHAAERERTSRGQIAHPQGPSGRLGQMHQRRVFAQRHALAADQVRVQGPRDCQGGP
jgi:TIR domain